MRPYCKVLPFYLMYLLLNTFLTYRPCLNLLKYFHAWQKCVSYITKNNLNSFCMRTWTIPPSSFKINYHPGSLPESTFYVPYKTLTCHSTFTTIKNESLILTLCKLGKLNISFVCLYFRSGLFVVGPESAGAHPGPACYRKGKRRANVKFLSDS